jgi:hypothetical protein
MLLVGLQKILAVIKPYEQLESRSFLTHCFNEIEEAEVLSTFLPGLKFNRWKFDPDTNTFATFEVARMRLLSYRWCLTNNRNGGTTKAYGGQYSTLGVPAS